MYEEYKNVIDESIIKNTEEELTAKGVAKIKFYHQKNSLNENAFTVCLLLNKNNELLSRGISICSLLDTFEKKKGRTLAFGRSFSALKNESDKKEIVIKRSKDSVFEYVTRTKKIKDEDELKEFLNIITKVDNVEYATHVVTSNGATRKLIRYNLPYVLNIHLAGSTFRYKSEYMPYPTEFESNVLGCELLAHH